MTDPATAVPPVAASRPAVPPTPPAAGHRVVLRPRRGHCRLRTISNSTFYSNKVTDGFGGAIYGDKLRLSNVTIAKNSPAGRTIAARPQQKATTSFSG